MSSVFGQNKLDFNSDYISYKPIDIIKFVSLKILWQRKIKETHDCCLRPPRYDQTILGSSAACFGKRQGQRKKKVPARTSQRRSQRVDARLYPQKWTVSLTSFRRL